MNLAEAASMVLPWVIAIALIATGVLIRRRRNDG